MFTKAVKRDAKLRLALCGSAGSGKTFTSLRLATALGGPIAYVDTEHGSASKYAHTDTCQAAGPCHDPSHFEFDVIEPHSYDPRELSGFIDAAVKQDYRVICIDSLSHYWMGPGGELDLVDAKAKTERNNSFAAWKTVTPYHNALVDKMLSAPIHVLVSMRTKTEWVVEKDDKGKSHPRKIGTSPIMRDGIEFEFDVCGDLDQDNNLAITKTRCSALAQKVIYRPGKEMAEILRVWLAGAPVEKVSGIDGEHSPARDAATKATITTSAPVKSPDETLAPTVYGRPVPDELQIVFRNIDKDFRAVSEAYKMLESELAEKGGTKGTEAYARTVQAFREKFPRINGKLTETKLDHKDCLLDLWDQLQTFAHPVPE